MAVPALILAVHVLIAVAGLDAPCSSSLSDQGAPQALTRLESPSADDRREAERWLAPHLAE